MKITKEDLAGVGLAMESLEDIGECDGRHTAELEPGDITVDLDRLTALGMREVRITFEPAKSYDSCFIAEEITISWSKDPEAG